MGIRIFTATGREYFTVSTDGIGTNLLVSRVLCRVFGNLPNLNSSMEVHHKDGNKNNNRLDNLEALSMEAHYEITHNTSYTEPSKCCDCETPVAKGTVRCILCRAEYMTTYKDITEESIVYWVTKHSWVRAGKELGLSDNGLRKRYKKLSGKDPKQLTKGV